MDGDARMVDDSETGSAHFGSKVVRPTTQLEISRTVLANDISADISGIPLLTPQEDTMQMSSILVDNSFLNRTGGMNASAISESRRLLDGHGGPDPNPVKLTPGKAQLGKAQEKTADGKLVPTYLEFIEKEGDKPDNGSDSSYKERSRGSSLDRQGF